MHPQQPKVESPHYAVGGWAQPYKVDTWHYFDDADPAYRTTAICGVRCTGVSATNLLADYVGEPQPNDCAECRRRVEERKNSAPREEG